MRELESEKYRVGERERGEREGEIKRGREGERDKVSERGGE